MAHCASPKKTSEKEDKLLIPNRCIVNASLKKCASKRVHLLDANLKQTYKVICVTNVYDAQDALSWIICVIDF